jgi:hypothetical protein
VRLREIYILGKDSIDVEYYCPIKMERLVNKIRAGKSRFANEEPIKPLSVFEKV